MYRFFAGHMDHVQWHNYNGIDMDDGFFLVLSMLSNVIIIISNVFFSQIISRDYYDVEQNVSRSVIRFVPDENDDGSEIICRAINIRLNDKNHTIQDEHRIIVHCKQLFIHFCCFFVVN